MEAAARSSTFTPVMVAWDGRTVGKRVLGIRVVRAVGRPLDAGTVIVRQVLVQYLLLAAVPLFDDPKSRAGHDRIARTRVVRDRQD